jgi:hypothetical protein
MSIGAAVGERSAGKAVTRPPKGAVHQVIGLKALKTTAMGTFRGAELAFAW